MSTQTIYLAGPLFSLADRAHNLHLALKLENLGYTVILPQVEVLKFITGGILNLMEMAKDCKSNACNPENILVANIDGPDADSGTAIEYGLAIQCTGRAVVYRTDIRTSPKKEVGLNAMFQLPGTILIELPCLASYAEEIEDFYNELADKIHQAITDLK